MTCFFSAKPPALYRRKSCLLYTSLGAALKEAISNNQLKLVYQPQIFAETGELYGIEALARWYDPLPVSYTHLDVYKRQGNGCL